MARGMTSSCHCGAVRIETKRPDYINECNCSLCGKAGVRWAYFHPGEVTVAGETKSWSRTDKPEPNAEVHFCPQCGATTHFTLTATAQAKHGNTLIGVNMRLADEAELAGVELRFPDGKAWDGGSDFGYVREAVVLGE